MPTFIFEYKWQKVFVGSYWAGMAKRMKQNKVRVQVNCVANAAYDCPKVHVLHVDMGTIDGLEDQLKIGLVSTVYLLTQLGKSILIHSIGECTAGAFVVLLLGFMNMFEGKSETWKDAVDHAQATFAAKRPLSAVQNSENRQSVKEFMEIISDPSDMLESLRSHFSEIRRKATSRALLCAHSKAGAQSKARPRALPPQSVQSVQSSPSRSFEVATLL